MSNEFTVVLNVMTLDSVIANRKAVDRRVNRTSSDGILARRDRVFGRWGIRNIHRAEPRFSTAVAGVGRYRKAEKWLAGQLAATNNINT